MAVDYRWSAVMSLEIELGHCHLFAGGDTHETPYACLRLLVVTTSTGPRRTYRAVTWATRSVDRKLAGNYRTLRETAKAARRHRAAEVAPASGESAPRANWG